MKRVLLFYIFLFILAAIPITWYAWPKSMPHPVSPDYMQFLYRGFAINDGTSIFGKQLFAVAMENEFDGSHWRVECITEKYNPYKAYYSDGTLLHEGECMNQFMYFADGPYPDWYDVRWAKCYKPDGSLGSEVIDGTGTQMIWLQDGTKIWELKLANYQRAAHTKWYPNGQLHVHQKYKDGRVHGSFIGYYPSGVKQIEGAYEAGERTGEWIRYNEDGAIDSTESN